MASVGDGAKAEDGECVISEREIKDANYWYVKEEGFQRKRLRLDDGVEM